MSLRSAVLRVVLGVGGYLLLAIYLLTHAPREFALLAMVGLSIVPAVVAIPGLFALFAEFVTFARDQPLERWQGNYYSFDGYQVRIIEEGATVWIVLDDALARAKVQASETELAKLDAGSLCHLESVGRRAIAANALLTLLARRNYRDANVFRLWLEREVLPPIHRKRTGQRVPYRHGEQAGGSPSHSNSSKP